MHEHSFPDSAEAPDQRTARAIEALQYEERAGLGFRRRRRGALGNPYADPERYQVDRAGSPADLWAGYVAGLGLVLGASALLYRPLLLGTVAVALTILGAISDGPAKRISAIGIIVTGICAPAGMLLSIFVTHGRIF